MKITYKPHEITGNDTELTERWMFKFFIEYIYIVDIK